jgi:hypothetical protein
VKQRLPEEHQLDRVTGHTGRHSFVSGGKNSGVDAVTVAKSSKHRSTKSLQRYNHPDDSKKVATMTKMAVAVRDGAASRYCDTDSGISNIPWIALFLYKLRGTPRKRGLYVMTNLFSTTFVLWEVT